MNSSKPWILIIDDEAELTRSLKEKLEEEGYLVSTCGDVSTACQILETKKFCCIVIDQKLRGGTGDFVITKIRNTPNHLNGETPICYMSAHLSASFLRKIGNAVDSILIKPFGRSEFAEKIKDLCPIEA